MEGHWKSRGDRGVSIAIIIIIVSYAFLHKFWILDRMKHTQETRQDIIYMTHLMEYIR